MLESVNWVGVGAAVIAAFILGFVWYGPLFSRPWMRELGKTPEQIGTEGPPLAPILAAQLVATIITATVLAIIIERFGPGVTTGLIVGLLCAAGFAATSKLGDLLFAQTSTPKRYWIETGNHLVSYALMGAVYGLFG
ncbi:MAG: DUF1761 domain-containing protein [Chloroflexota bacterium]|nr:DUF1761 domain-containing protein [Chloroflexota bacterium]